MMTRRMAPQRIMTTAEFYYTSMQLTGVKNDFPINAIIGHSIQASLSSLYCMVIEYRVFNTK